MSSRSRTSPSPSPSPWRDRAFRRLWAGLTASQLGEQAGLVILPLLAVTVLHAGAGQLGGLRAAYQLPVLLSLVAGVLADRWRPRAVMVAADGLRAVVLLAIPVLHLAGLLPLPALVAAAVLLGTCSIGFDVAYQVALVRLVPLPQLVAATSASESSRSATRIGGPALGGALVSLLSAPYAAVAAALSFAGSALLVRTVREPGPATGAGTAASPLCQAYEGLRLVARDGALRAVALASAAFQFAFAALMTCYLLFLARTLDLPGAAVGIVLAGTGPGAVAGSVLAGFLPRRLGYGRVLLVAAVLADLVLLAVPAVRGPATVTVPLLVAVNVAFGLLGQVVDVTVVTLRQALTPVALQGRVVATINLAGMGLTPLGSLLGGVLAGAWGTRPTLLATALALALSPLVIALSPLARIGRTLPRGALPRGNL